MQVVGFINADVNNVYFYLNGLDFLYQSTFLKNMWYTWFKPLNESEEI